MLAGKEIRRNLLKNGKKLNEIKWLTAPLSTGCSGAAGRRSRSGWTRDGACDNEDSSRILNFVFHHKKQIWSRRSISPVHEALLVLVHRPVGRLGHLWWLSFQSFQCCIGNLHTDKCRKLNEVTWNFRPQWRWGSAGTGGTRRPRTCTWKTCKIRNFRFYFFFSSHFITW